MSRDDYRFRDKDEIIQIIRTEMQRTFGNLSQDKIGQLAYDSGVSPSTINNWLFGDVRFPRHISTKVVLQELGVQINYVREDGTTIRQPQPTFITKAEQEKILRKDRQREKEKEKAKHD